MWLRLQRCGGRIIKQSGVCVCCKAQKVIILMAHIWKRESARGRRVAFIPVVVQIGRNPTHAKFIPGRAKVLLLLVFGYCSSVCERETSSHPRFLCPRSLLLYMLVYIYKQAGGRKESFLLVSLSLCSVKRDALEIVVCVRLGFGTRTLLKEKLGAFSNTQKPLISIFLRSL